MFCRNDSNILGFIRACTSLCLSAGSAFRLSAPPKKHSVDAGRRREGRREVQGAKGGEGGGEEEKPPPFRQSHRLRRRGSGGTERASGWWVDGAGGGGGRVLGRSVTAVLWGGGLQALVSVVEPLSHSSGGL